MSRRISITETDFQRLKKLVADIEDDIREQMHVRDLRREMDRAQIVPPNRLSADVISMKTRVMLRVDGEDEEVSLVYPNEADVDSGAISVLSPIGTAILGYREGDHFEWQVPAGTAKVEVIRILYQPEAAERGGMPEETE